MNPGRLRASEVTIQPELVPVLGKWRASVCAYRECTSGWRRISRVYTAPIYDGQDGAVEGGSRLAAALFTVCPVSVYRWSE